ncbi:MAG TPA: hypothetical protein VFV91_02485 [Gaiellaceae bacterium]|nr:hypothetical protein [Gaiellaceae bacterium]
MDITTKDQQLITADEIRQFDAKLARALTFAELAEMRLSRLMSAHDVEELGGWPEGYEFPTEAVAAFALLADSLENEAERMLEWAKNVRAHSTHLWFVRGTATEPHA